MEATAERSATRLESGGRVTPGGSIPLASAIKFAKERLKDAVGDYTTAYYCGYVDALTTLQEEMRMESSHSGKVVKPKGRAGSSPASSARPKAKSWEHTPWKQMRKRGF